MLAKVKDARFYFRKVSSRTNLRSAPASGAKDALVLAVLKGAQLLATNFVSRLCSSDNGQDLIEYSLLAGLISLVAVAIIINLGTGVNSVWQGVNGTVGLIPTTP